MVQDRNVCMRWGNRPGSNGPGPAIRGPNGEYFGTAECEQYAQVAQTCEHELFGVAEYNVCQNRANGSTLGTCASPEFGVQAYNLCQHESFGIEGYHSCRHDSFGVETFKECAHIPDVL